MKNQNLTTATPAANLPTFKAFVLNDNLIDETPDGYGLVLHFSGTGEREASESIFRARLVINAEIRPLFIFRMDGKWCLNFEIGGPKGEYAFAPAETFAVECGEESGLSFEEAARHLFGI